MIIIIIILIVIIVVVAIRTRVKRDSRKPINTGLLLTSRINEQERSTKEINPFLIRKSTGFGVHTL